MPGSSTVTSFGRVISVRGSLARVGLLASSQLGLSAVRATVGRFVSIRCANSTIVAMITEVSCEDLPTSDAYIASASVDLLGEILGGPERPKFQRGVTNYPTIGDTVDLISNQELRTVYAPTGSDQISVGTLQQDRSVIAYVDVEEMLSKHFAVLGSTGVGKSSQDTSVIMATMVEFAQRMLTNRPTVALISEFPIWLVARSPTRARDPRTEITRPKDVTVVEPGMIWIGANTRCTAGIMAETRWTNG